MGIIRKMYTNVIRNFVLIVALICSTQVLAIKTGEAINTPINSFPLALQLSLTDQPYWNKGYLDITKPPYNAKGDGVTDDTTAIQQAMNDAFLANLVVHFPGDRVYLVSDQLKAIKTSVSRLSGFALEGSTVGKKPVLRLQDDSVVEGNTLIHFATYVDGIESPPVAYNNTLRGIDIDMGKNPNVSAVSMNGNQYNIIQDVKVYGTDFFAGFHKIPGCGGGMVNVSVIGGQYGIYQDEFRPEPTVFGLYLENQSKNAIYIDESRGPLIIAGFKIVSPLNRSQDYRAIYADDHFSVTKEGSDIVDHAKANMVLHDGTIELRGSNSGTAIENRSQDFSIKNVYIKAENIITSGSIHTSDLHTLAGDSARWAHISQYLYTSVLDKGTVFMEGLNLNDRTRDFIKKDQVVYTSILPPIDFLHLHSWKSYINWEDKNVIDIVTDFGATPATVNSTDDDYTAIQAAINAVTDPSHEHFGKSVFIPRGFFHVSQTLLLKDNLTLIGSSRMNSMILPTDIWLGGQNPVVRTEDSNVGNIYLAEFGIINNDNQPAAIFSANNMVIKDLGTERYGGNETKFEENSPLYLFTGNIGAKVYHLCLGSVPDKTGYGLEPRENYHLLQVKDNQNPIDFYHLNIAHLPNSPQVNFTRASQVRVFGYKYEFEHELMHITDSESIKMYGGSGNYQLKLSSDEAIFVIKNSRDIVIENFGRRESDAPTRETYWIKYENQFISGRYPVLYFESPRNMSEPNFQDPEQGLPSETKLDLNDVELTPQTTGNIQPIRSGSFPPMVFIFILLISILSRRTCFPSDL